MILDKLPYQTVCTIKDDKGKECGGHLKKYYPFAEYFSDADEHTKQEIRKEFGTKEDLMLYRCKLCKAVYRPGANAR